MTNVQKRSGKKEAFDRKKLEKSMRSAGASEKIAGSIAENIKPKEGLATAEIRKTVVAELKRNDPGLSKRFEDYKATPGKSAPVAHGKK